MTPETFTDELVHYVWGLAAPSDMQEPLYCTVPEALRHFINCDDCYLTFCDELAPHCCETFNLMTRGAPTRDKQGPPIPDEMLDPVNRAMREMGRSLERSIRERWRHSAEISSAP